MKKNKVKPEARKKENDKKKSSIRERKWQLVQVRKWKQLFSKKDSSDRKGADDPMLISYKNSNYAECFYFRDKKKYCYLLFYSVLVWY